MRFWAVEGGTLDTLRTFCNENKKKRTNRAIRWPSKLAHKGTALGGATNGGWRVTAGGWSSTCFFKEEKKQETKCPLRNAPDTVIPRLYSHPLDLRLPLSSTCPQCSATAEAGPP